MFIKIEVVGCGELYHVVGDDGVSMYEYDNEAQATEQMNRLQEQGLTTQKKLNDRIGVALFDGVYACIE